MKKKYCVFLLSVLSVFMLNAQKNHNSFSFSDNLSRSLSHIYEQTMLRPGKITVDSVAVNHKKKTVECYANLMLSYMPMRDKQVAAIYDSVRFYLPAANRKYRVSVFTDKREISELVPNYFRGKPKDKRRIIAHKVKTPLVTNVSAPIHNFDKGLSHNHIALWQSHGWYYEQKLGRWEWQRARIFQTVEDLYTQSYVLPFLTPMLENAGANVLLPRERDYNSTEIIVDNDADASQSQYSEKNGKEPWQTADSAGFANPKAYYLNGENPFRMGTARQVRTINRGTESLATWTPEISKKDYYGVYVAYQTVRNSADDALYSVYHAGGKTDFHVNQKMGGGTWIFLGYFLFDKEKGHRITLSNKSRRAGKVVTADAVKIGGGMGNIARMPFPKIEENNQDKADEGLHDNIQYHPEISGYPRYTEGARYWMQWAGIPDSIYNRTEGKNDYTDDYASRGYWVNYLAGGSSVLPKAEGLQIPIDMALAFHSDAGTFWGDTIVGTLGIYMTRHNDERFENGSSRWASRDLTDMVMSEIVTDIRREYEPDWTRRHMWNRSYAEARVPNVPTMLLELLSHQNFADMRYGLDPTFRFTVSRSIYKGILKFIATRYNRNYVVQPLPVKDFSISFLEEDKVQLRWHPTPDNTEPTATSTKYIVYTRVGEGGFDNGFVTDKNHCTIKIKKDVLYSFKIEAVNDGGKSFPSEILSACRVSNQKGEALIVNGFTRVSAPYSFTTSDDSLAGFVGSVDNGVPYLSEHQFVGHMHEFRRVIPWMDDDASGFGDSNGDYETTKIAGNTFDYPAIHGKAFTAAGYSFVSCAASAVENGTVDLKKYRTVDWILGKQREWSIARGAKPPKYKTFSTAQQQAITAFCQNGGNIIVSGAFVGTDFWDNPFATDADKTWARQTLKYKWRNNNGAVTGHIKAVASPFRSIVGKYNYFNTLNSESYVVENPDAIEPVDNRGFTVFRYSENNLSAGVFYKGNTYSTCILGFPIESIKGQQNRNRLLKGILEAMK